jgi:hypothetical protein
VPSGSIVPVAIAVTWSVAPTYGPAPGRVQVHDFFGAPHLTRPGAPRYDCSCPDGGRRGTFEAHRDHVDLQVGKVGEVGRVREDLLRGAGDSVLCVIAAIPSLLPSSPRRD